MIALSHRAAAASIIEPSHCTPSLQDERPSRTSARCQTWSWHASRSRSAAHGARSSAGSRRPAAPRPRGAHARCRPIALPSHRDTGYSFITDRALHRSPQKLPTPPQLPAPSAPQHAAPSPPASFRTPRCCRTLASTCGKLVGTTLQYTCMHAAIDVRIRWAK
jgi:hypothetical protein